MAGPDAKLFIRVAANLDELKRNLSEGKAQIETTTAAMSKMAASFQGDKLIQQAHNVAAAVNQIGGASKLTAAEQERVNGVITRALEKYAVLGKEAPAALRQLAEETSKQKVSWGEVATAVGAVAGVVTGLAAGVAALGDRGAGVADVRDSFSQLAGAMGESATVMLGRLREATLGNVSDFELMKTVNLGLSQGLKLTTDQAGTLGDAAAVLADRIGGDVNTAFSTLITAMATGQDRTLKTIGLNIDAAKAAGDYAASIGKTVAELTEAERVGATQAAILAEARRTLELSGKAQADFGDKVAQSKTALSNFVDQVSAWIATTPAIGTFSSAITAASSTVTALGLAWGPMSGAVAKLLPLLGLSGGVAGLFTSLSGVISGTVLPLVSSALPLALKGLAALFTMPVGLVVAGIAAVVTIWKNWDTIGPIVQKVYTTVKEWLVDKFAAVVGKIKGAIDSVTGFFKDMYDKVVGHSFVPDLVDGIRVAFARLKGEMVDPARDATNRVNDAFSTMLGNVVSILDQIGSDTARAFADVINGSRQVYQALKGGNYGDALNAGLQTAANVTGNKTVSYAASGAAIGTAIMPGWGTAIGAGVGALVGLFSSDDEARVEAMRAAFIKAAGGLETLKEKAKEAGVTLGALMRADTPREYALALEQVMDALDEHQRQVDFLTDAMREYGITLGDLRGIDALKQLTTQGDQLAKQFRALEGAGVNVERISSQMADRIRAYVKECAKAGVDIPTSMEAIIHQLQVMGLLTDKNSLKESDAVAKSTAALDALMQHRQSLADSIANEAPEEVMGVIEARTRAEMAVLDKQIADQRRTMEAQTDGIANDMIQTFRRIDIPPVIVPVEWSVPPWRYGGERDEGGGQGFASGTMGRFLDFGQGTHVILHGRERVMTEAEGRREGSAPINLGGLTAEIQAMRREFAAGQRNQRTDLIFAVRDGMSQRGRR